MQILAILALPSPKANIAISFAFNIDVTPIVMAFLGTLDIDPKSEAAAIFVVFSKYTSLVKESTALPGSLKPI